MKRKLPLVATVMLLICFSISALLYVFYDFAQLQFKIEARQDMEAKSDLQTVRLSVGEFNKNKEKDELWIGGKLYDISSYVVTGNDVLVSVFHDEKEEGLVKDIADSFEPNDRYSSDNIIHLAKHRIHPPDDNKILVAGYAVEAALPAYVYLPSLQVTQYTPLVFASVIKPPPKVC